MRLPDGGAVLTAGRAGAPTDAIDAVSGGTPSPGYRMGVQICRFINVTPALHQDDRIESTSGAGAAGATAERGTDGLVTLAPRSWCTPEVVDATIACAREAFRNGHRELARQLLDPYLAHLETAELPVELLPAQTAVRTLRELLLSNVDYYGNPPGWLPRLNLDTSLAIFRTLHESSTKLLYWAGKMAATYDAATDAAALAERTAAALDLETRRAAAELGKCFDVMTTARGQLDSLAARVAEAQKRVEMLRTAAYHDATTSVEKQRLFSGVVKIVGGTLQALPVGQPYVGLAGGAVAAVGDINWNAADGGAESVRTSTAKIGALVDAFQSDNKELLAAAGVGSSAERGARLAERLAESVEATGASNQRVEKQLRAGQERDEKARAALIVQADDTPEAVKLRSRLDDVDERVLGSKALAAELKELGGALSRTEAKDLLAERQRLTDALAGVRAAQQAPVQPAETDEQKKQAAQRTAELAALEAGLHAGEQRLLALQSQVAQAAADKPAEERALADRKAAVQKTMGQLKGVGTGLGAIGDGIATLMAPVEKDDPEVMRLAKRILDGKSYLELETLLLKARTVGVEQAAVVKTFEQARRDMATHLANISDGRRGRRRHQQGAAGRQRSARRPDQALPDGDARPRPGRDAMGRLRRRDGLQV